MVPPDMRQAGTKERMRVKTIIQGKANSPSRITGIIVCKHNKVSIKHSSVRRARQRSTYGSCCMLQPGQTFYATPENANSLSK